MFTRKLGTMELSLLYKRPMVSIGLGLALVLLITIIYRSESVRYVTMPMASLSSTPQRVYATTPAPEKNYVLLITYGRSGSTFTSALISHHPDVFFTFEPLYVLQQRGAVTPKIYSESARNESIAILKSFFTCDFPQEFLYTLDNTQHRNSDATKDFYRCIQAKKDGIYHLTCYMKFLEDCRHHKTMFIKTIRLRVEWAEELLKTYPNLKLLYLIRDPRATLYSQAHVFGSFKWATQAKNVSNIHCQLIHRDLVAAEQLKVKYPDRIMGLRYENGATDPFAYTKKIYNFLGLDYNEEVANYVQNITHSSKKPQGRDSYGIVKDNATKAMNKWRYTAGFNSVRAVDSVCHDVYPKLGYLIVDSQKHLESDYSLVTVPQLGSIFD